MSLRYQTFVCFFFVVFFFTAVQTQVSSGMRKEALQHDRTSFKLSTSSKLVHKLDK